jgi:NADPH-dependent curcumin reductase CurA
MLDKINRQVHLLSRPQAMPALSNFEIRTTSVPSLKENEILVHSLYLSIDPYMRGRMAGRPFSHPPFELNACLIGKVIGTIVASNNIRFKKGELVRGRLDWADYSIVTDDQIEKITPYEDITLPTWLGVLGSPGMTAYFGILELGQPKAGETVVVTSAAGAVGSIVGQIAKIKGCKVIGITGSDTKVEYLTQQLHFDMALNYKKPNFAEDLKHCCDKGIDIYFDNVGGTITDLAMLHLNKFSRIVLCGQISTYNSEGPDVGLRHFRTLILKSATVKGLVVWDFKDRFEEAKIQLIQWMREGRLQSRENIIEGLDNAPKAFIDLFNGENIGKQLVKIS